MIQANERTLDYFKVHNWLQYYFGSASKCENPDCKFANPKRFEWALIKGKKCEKDRSNFMMLCPSCHRKYDYTEAQKDKQSKAKTGQSAKNKIAVSQYTLDGIFIKKYDSYTAAAEAVGGIPTAFSAIKRGRLKTYKSFLWQF